MFFKAYSEHKDSISVYSEEPSASTSIPTKPSAPTSIPTISKSSYSEPKRPISTGPANIGLSEARSLKPLPKETSIQAADKTPLKKLSQESDLIPLSDLIKE